jgi:hypothetical protein
MGIDLLFAILGLMIVELLLFPRSLPDFRIMQKMRRETAPKQGLPLSLGHFVGCDTNGRPLALRTDARTSHWIGSCGNAPRQCECRTYRRLIVQ